jgi:hypothetical protein
MPVTFQQPAGQTAAGLNQTTVCHPRHRSAGSVRRHWPGLVGLVLAALVVASADAGMIVVDNLNEFVPPVGGGGISGYNYNFSTGQFETASRAGSFVVGAGSWEIEGITIRVQEWHPTPLDVNNPDTMLLRILSDNAGSPGSTVVGTLLPTTNIYLPGTYLFAPTSETTLSAGRYWLAGLPTAFGSPTSSIYDWYATGTGADNGILGWSIDSGFRDSSNLGASWSGNVGGFQSLMYRIEAAAVPEPASMLLVLSGVALMFVRFGGRRERRSER